MTPRETIETLVRARYPMLAIGSHEEDRVQAVVQDVATQRNKQLICWTVTRGLHESDASAQSRKLTNRDSTDPVQALDEVIKHVEPAIFLFKDFHPYLGQPQVVRKLRDVADELRSSYKTVVFVSPQLPIPLELEKDVTIVDFPLPGLDELKTLLAETVREVNEHSDLQLDPKTIAVEAILKAAQGLTLREAENVFAKALVQGGRLTEADIPLILEEKQQIVRRSGILEYYPVQDTFAQVGGLELLKSWLRKRRLAFSERAREYGLPYPRGVLLVGVQGCGKSLCAKSVSALWGLPLLRFDVGRVFTSAVGSSEQNMREAIRSAESVAPAVLWIDEIEKAFSGVGSSDVSDGGTAARVFASFLTWLQEKRSAVFVIATANSVSRCPPELLRKGRLDELFFVDLPAARERQEILSIHLARRQRDPSSVDLARLAAACEGFSGAEIEEAVISALFEAFEAGSELTTELLQRAFEETVPLSKTMEEGLQALRSWASGRARPASAGEPEAPPLAADGGRFEI